MQRMISSLGKHLRSVSFAAPPAPPFTPASISGLTIWLDATDVTTMNGGSIADGASCSSIVDKSANAYTFTSTLTKRPVFHTNVINGLGALRFTNGNSAGTQQWMTNPVTGLVTTSSPFTLIQVIRLTSFINPYLNTFSFGGADNAHSPCFEVSNAAPDKAYMFGCTNTSSPFAFVIGLVSAQSTATLTAGTWYYITLDFIGSAPTAPASFSTLLSGTTQTLTNSTAEANWGTAASGTVFGGYDASGTNSHNWHGDIAEVIFYNKVISAADYTNIKAYLNTKYGL